MSTATEPEVTSQALVEVQRALPIPQTRFDEYIIKAHGLADTAKQECADALTHEIDSEGVYQLVDTLMASFKKRAKENDDERMGHVRPIDDFRQTVHGAGKESVDIYEQTAKALGEKMSAYRRLKKLQAEQAQRAAEAELAAQRARLETEAARLEQKAETLKTDAAKARVLGDAEALRQTAALTPATVALSAPAPQNVASDVGDKWEWESFPSVAAFLHWLADHPEWHTLVVNPKTGKPNFPVSEMNRMAKQFRDVVPVPGIKFHSIDSFRTKSR